jgi:hypothetical protein
VLHEEDHFNGTMATMMNSVSNPSIKGDGTAQDRGSISKVFRR